MQCHAKGLHCSVYLVEPGERSRQRLIGSHAVLMSPCSLSALPPCSLHAGVSDDPASLRQWMAPPVLPRVHLHPDADRFHRQLRSADRLFGPRCDNALACHQFSPVVRAWFATAPADVPMGPPPPNWVVHRLLPPLRSVLATGKSRFLRADSRCRCSTATDSLQLPAVFHRLGPFGLPIPSPHLRLWLITGFPQQETGLTAAVPSQRCGRARS